MPSRFMISAIAVPSFIRFSPCLGPVWPGRFSDSWNRNLSIGKARAARERGSADMRLAGWRICRGSAPLAPRRGGYGGLFCLAVEFQHLGQQNKDVFPDRSAGFRPRVGGVMSFASSSTRPM
jgi:hypothetical protein